MIAIIITLSVLLFAAAFIAGTCMRNYFSIESKYKAQCKRIERFNAALEDTKPTYSVKYLTDGRLAVVRMSGAMGCINLSVVKTFEDEDAQYNVLCAEELCEHLNEK